MGRIVVRTKSNRTGRRVLKTPLEDRLVCAPANKRYSQCCKAIEAEFKRNFHKPWQAYIEKVSEVIASYVGSRCTSDEGKYRIIRFLAEGGLREDAGRAELREMLGRPQVEEEAWQTYLEEFGKLLKEREEGLKTASYEHGVEKRALWREITDQIHYECHPDDDKRTKSEKAESRKLNRSKSQAS